MHSNILVMFSTYLGIYLILRKKRLILIKYIVFNVLTFIVFVNSDVFMLTYNIIIVQKY